MGQAGERVGDTVQRVDQVMVLIRQIKEAGQEQARGIAQIGEAVRQLDAATQQNAALVDDSSSASDGMKHQARRLLDVVRRFRLDPEAAVQPTVQAGQGAVADSGGPLQPALPAPRKRLAMAPAA